MENLFYAIAIVAVVMVIHDKYIQRQHQLLINYPLIGRMRYFFEAVREPFRQYFADETFYGSKDKVDWVYSAAGGTFKFVSFSPNQPQKNPKWLIKHSNIPLNNEEVKEDFSVVFGTKRKYPFETKSIIGRSAMSDGAISPEGTRAFSKGAYEAKSPINTGEGGLTTNFIATHSVNDEKFLDVIKISEFDQTLYAFIRAFTNRFTAISYFRNKYLPKDLEDTYAFDSENRCFFRIKWDAPLEDFPNEVPEDIPDMIFQMSSGLYGVRDENGAFSEERYQKLMRFCKMTEIKLAQGAKQTGGKLVASKVTESIAYYRGVKANENLFSPNRFPHAKTIKDLFDFVARLQKLSDKPVGFKLVISSREQFEEYVREMYNRKSNGMDGVPDFISIDGGDGGSATAPIFLMDSVGLSIQDAVFLADETLKEFDLRDDIKIIASSKVLTPDDVIINLSLGADFIGIARGFMLSAGCIRARMCSGQGSHQCPVGLATQDKKLRRSFLVHKQASKVRNYHNNLIAGVRTILAIMGKNCTSQLHKRDLTFIDRNGFIHSDIEEYYKKKVRES